MKTINGERYYVSIGYVEDENDTDIRNIKSLIMQSKEGTVYIDNSDKDSNIILPLMPVNQIQKIKNNFQFRFLFKPFDTKWVNKDNKLIEINRVGLFAVSKENNIENIRKIGFYKMNKCVFLGCEPARTFNIEVEEEKIMGVH